MNEIFTPEIEIMKNQKEILKLKNGMNENENCNQEHLQQSKSKWKIE